MKREPQPPMSRNDTILLAVGTTLAGAGGSALIAFVVAESSVPQTAWVFAWAALIIGLVLFALLLLTGRFVRTLRAIWFRMRRLCRRFWHKIHPPPTYASAAVITPEEWISVSIDAGEPRKGLPDELMCQVMPLPSGAVSKTEAIHTNRHPHATVTFPGDFKGMKFVPGDYHYWWTTRTRRNPRIEDGPELASGAFHYDERYRPTFRQREDGGVSIFLRYPLSEQPVLHGCAVKPPGADTPEELTEEAFINHDDGVAELRYPGDFRTQNAPPLSNGRYTFQWYRVQTDGGHKAIPPAPIASPGEFEINDGEVLHNAYEEDEWWPRYLTVGRQPLLVLRNLAGRAVHGFRCEIEGDGVRYVADQAEMEERLGLLQPYELPHPSDKTDFAFPGAFGAPALTQWELGEYTVTWYAWRELPGSAFGVEPYELLQHKLVIGRGGTVQL